MPTANELIQDRQIRHMVYLQRLAGGTVKDILEILTLTERDVRRILRERLSAIQEGATLSARETARIEGLLSEIRSMRLATYRQAGRELDRSLRELGEYEIEFQERMIQSAAPVDLALGTTTAVQQVAEIVTSRPFNGLILSDWVADLADKELSAIKRQIQIGMTEGQGIRDIVNRVAGSPRGAVQGVMTEGTKGVLGAYRRHAETWVRSAVSHTANEARDALYAANTDVLKGVQWLATLDKRTTPLCIARDGFVYSLPDHKPVDGGPPWSAGPGRLHPRCRSSSSPVLRSWDEIGIDLDEAPPGTRESMNGQVPGKTTYREWIKRQPKGVQTDVLGARRAKALRDGDLSVADLFDDQGRFWTLDQLKEREGIEFG